MWCEKYIFLGYSSHGKTYYIYHKRTKVVEESIHVVFDEFNGGSISPSSYNKPKHNKDDEDKKIKLEKRNEENLNHEQQNQSQPTNDNQDTKNNQ